MKTKNILPFIAVLLFSVSCQKDSDPKPEILKATISTTSISNIAMNSASSGGNISADGGASVTARGVVWGTSSSPSISLSTKTSDGTGTGIFSSTLTGLAPSTTYFVRAYATNTEGTAYGNEVSFTTVTNLPTLNTTAISSITSSTASSGGNVSSDGGTSVTARGVVWSTSNSPTISLSTKTSDGTGTGAFSSSLTGLAIGTNYYVRAYATNSSGTAYGNEVTFTTPSNAVLTTSIVGNITGTSSSSGGNITSDGGASITSRGVCWGTSPNPTISLGTKTVDGNGTGSYTSNVTGLTDGIRYYLRAYATNEVGTSYGNEVTFQAVAPFTDLDNAIAAKMTQYNIPGLSVAIVKNEKLVYIRSYGYADIQSNQIASNDDLYRIASVSKPITAIAIFKLVQDGLITLDQKVFGTGGILGNDYGSPPVGSNKDLITVRHLLDHKSGWTNSPNDPMFTNISNTQSQLITDIVTNRPLVYSPGSTYYYLNIGYCILGRVIEKVTNNTYENYVKSNATAIGISNIKIGGNTLAERFPNEVKYYQTEFSPYAMNVRRMDAHGGWIASSTDLARFIIRIDRNNSVPDIISTTLLNQFYFGYTNWIHYGSLPGTSSILNRLNDTFSFVVLTNTRTESNPDLILNDLNSTVTGQINSRSIWPTYDLF